MDQCLRKIAFWRPRPPVLTWIFAALPVVFGLTPLIAALLLLITKSHASPSNIAISEWMRVTWFTIWQASITCFGVILISPVLAVALHTLSYPIKQLTIVFRTLTYTLPATIVATAYIIAWGKSGLFTAALAKLGINAPIWNWLYSPWGLILVNTSMNLPFASVLLSQAMASIPEHLWESATTLGLRPIQSLKSICFPAIRTPLLLISLVTFSVSMGTFGAVAILGGGPASQTLEMSTYIALFAYGDWRSAAIFAITHTAINAAAVAILLISQRKTFLHHVSAPFKKTEQAARWIIPNIIRSHAVKRSLIILSITFDIALAVPVCAVLYDAFALCFQSSVSTEVLNFLGRAALTSLGFAIPVAFLTTLSGWILSRGYFARASDTKSWQSGILLNTPMVGAMIPGMALAFGYWTIRSFRGSELGPNLFIIPTLTVLSMPFVIPLIFPSFARDVHPYLDARRLMGIPNFLWHRTVEGPAMLKPLLISTTLTLILTLNETSVVTVLRPPEDPALSSALLVLMGRYKFSEAALGSAILICVNFVFLAMAARSNEGCHGRS